LIVKWILSISVDIRRGISYFPISYPISYAINLLPKILYIFN